MKNKTEMPRPSILATLLWALGILLIGLTIYSTINWRVWTEWSTQDLLLVVVSIATGINSIATGALINMAFIFILDGHSFPWL